MSDRSNTLSNRLPKPLRWTHRLHGLSWILFLLMTICMVLIIIPGMPDSDRVNRHGWPLEYVQTPFADDAAVNLFDAYPIHWSSTAAWNWSRKIGKFNVPNFLVDVGLGALIVTGAVAACEVWRRRRGSYRFTLLDFFLAAALIACTFGWWKYHVRINAFEDAMVSSMNVQRSFDNWFAAGDSRLRFVRDYQGPEWLGRLLGNTALLPSFTHVSYLQVDSRSLTHDETQQLSQFRFLTTVKCEGQFTTELADALAALPRLRCLDGMIWSYSGDRPEPMFSSANIQLVKRLPNLSELSLGHCQLVPADLHSLTHMSRLERLQFCCDELLIEDLAPLTRLPSLQALEPIISSTEAERRKFEAEHPDLQVRWQLRMPWNPQSKTRTQDDELLEAQRVYSVLIRRWQVEDGAEEPATYDPRSLDLGPILLTKARLDRTPPGVLSNVQDLSLGAVESPSVAVALARRCEKLEIFDARRVPFAKSDLDRIQFAPNSEIYLQQGPNTLQDFCDLVATIRPNGLTIFASTFSEPEAERIQEMSPDTSLEVYPGFEDDPEESIYPNYNADSESPFH